MFPLSFDLTFDSGKTFLEEHAQNRLKGRDLELEKNEKKAQILKELGFAKEDGYDKIVELTPRFKGYDISINTEFVNKSRTEAIKESVQNILFKVSEIGE